MPKTILVSASLLGLALTACTTSNDPASNDTASRQDAIQAFSAVSASMNAASNAIGSPVASLVGTDIDISSPCSLGGDVSLTGSFESGAGTQFDVDAGFDACTEDEGVLDGVLHWNETVDAAGVTDAWQGTLDFTGDVGSFSCTFDYEMVVSATGSVHYSGTICGFDVEADLGL